MAEAAQLLQVIADLITILLGSVALYGLAFKRQTISRVLNIILNTHFNERVRRLRETLTQLHNTSFDDKTQYASGMALLGQLSGQLKPLTATRDELRRLHGDLVLLMEGKSRVKEARKNALTHEISAALDEAFMSEYVQVLKEGAPK